MKFSLVLGTVDRTSELSRLLRSLSEQELTDFELIVVDQNKDDRLSAVLAPWRDRMRIKHLRVPERGLSRARNIGLQHAVGDIVAFPDDDCWYASTLLSQVFEWLERHASYDGVTGQSRDAGGQPTQISGPPQPARISPRNVWHCAISYSIFLRRHVANTVGEFDETLGVGASSPWGSGEETDYLLRALAANYKLMYDPLICVFHPSTSASDIARFMARGRNYGAGMGRVLRKHQAPAWYMAYVLARALGGTVIALAQRDVPQARFHLNVFRGRLYGLLASMGGPDAPAQR